MGVKKFQRPLLIPGMTFTDGGELGIGEPDPQAPIHITLDNADDTGVDSSGIIIQNVGAGDAQMLFKVGDVITTWSVGIDHSSSDVFRISPALTLGSHALSIRTTKEVGIGLTPTIGRKFEVATTGQATAMYIADADGTMHFPWDGSAGSPNIAIGAGDDLALYHDGDSHIRNTVGTLFVTQETATNLVIKANNASGGDIRFQTRGSVTRVEINGQGLNLLPIAADPGTLTDGDVWINSTTDKLMFRSGGTTRTVTNT